MAEELGFEPRVACATAVFKTAALNHSTILPRCIIIKCHCFGVLSSFIHAKNRKNFIQFAFGLVKNANLWHIICNIVFNPI